MIILAGRGRWVRGRRPSCGRCARLQADPLKVDRNGEEVDCFGRYKGGRRPSGIRVTSLSKKCITLSEFYRLYKYCYFI